MILPDVNVLINAFRSDVAEHHRVCHSWLAGVVESDARFGISALALSALVRITTNPQVFKVPSQIAEALGFCDYLRDQPHCELVEPGERHWDIFKRLCVEADTRGSRVSDTWFAALAIERGCDWITFDRDFARFPGLSWRTPTAE